VATNDFNDEIRLRMSEISKRFGPVQAFSEV